MSSFFDIALVAINARFSHTNLAVRYLRNSLFDSGLNVTIIEKNINDRAEDILRELYFTETNTFGFSVYIWNSERCLGLAEELKQLKPDAKIIFGGPEVSFYGESFLEEYPFIDVLIKGEGEFALSDCLTGKTTEKIIKANPVNFSMMPFPYLPEDMDSLKNKMLYYETSRGCPFSCSYCLSGDNGKVRAKDVETVKEEIEKLLLFSPKVIKLTDRTFNFDRKRARELIKFFSFLKTDAVFHLEICAELLNEEDFTLLKLVPEGRIQLEVGVQSTNPQTLNAINRQPVALSKLKQLSELKNIHVHLDLIAGLPYEDYKIFEKSFNEIYYFADVLQLGFLKLLHGTPIRNDAQKFGMTFTRKAPYEILKNKYLSFEEITKLKEIEETLERFSNSHVFENALAIAIQGFESPFSFFEVFSECLKKNNQLFINSSREMDFESFYLFGREQGLTSDFYDMLKLDYTKIFRGKSRLFSYEYGDDFTEKCFTFYKNNEKLSAFIPEYAGMPAKNINKSCDIHPIGNKIMLFDRKSGNVCDITNSF